MVSVDHGCRCLRPQMRNSNLTQFVTNHRYCLGSVNLECKVIHILADPGYQTLNETSGYMIMFFSCKGVINNFRNAQ
eukprot:CCRYP_004523-RC/>CCRYP_004523-RC protein AED:0.23 eAED:0.23 QI:3333/0/0.5/1/0/0/2/0/76